VDIVNSVTIDPGVTLIIVIDSLGAPVDETMDSIKEFS
jgi:hypothetical protein